MINLFAVHCQKAGLGGYDTLEGVVRERALLITLGDKLLGLSDLLARLCEGPKFRNFIGLFILKSNIYKIHKSVIVKIL